MHERIAIDSKILGGKPVIKGTRIPVYLIVNHIAAGYTIEKIIDEYPPLTLQDIKAALEFAAKLTELEITDLP
jgi:uncharacterized protein (DUF433 family)